MPRTYARIKVSIWNDDDFRQLDDAAQALYLRLLSSPTLSLAGVCDWRPKRLALLTKGMAPRAVEKAGEALADAHYVMLDDDTDEALVRTFVKHEGVVVNPKTAAGLAAAFEKITSATLRYVLSVELGKLREVEPDLKGWDHLSAALAYAPNRPCETMPSGIRLGIASPIASDTDDVSDSVPIPLKPLSLSQKPVTGEPSAVADDVFDEFWSTYPKRVGKGQAVRAWKTALKKAQAAEIIRGAAAYASAVKGKDQQYTANPSTWLNGERWTDESGDGDAGPTEWFLLK